MCRFFKFQRDIEIPGDQNHCDEPNIKRAKSNICIECLGLFQNDFLDTIAREIVETTELSSYECNTIYTSISVPILIQIRELALWIYLLKQLPGKISESMILLMAFFDVENSPKGSSFHSHCTVHYHQGDFQIHYEYKIVSIDW